MPTGSYRVDYHLVQTIYFEPGQVPSGPEFAQLWSATRIFGSHRVVGAFWHFGGEIPSELPQFEIGSLGHVEPLLAKGAQPIYGGGTVAQKNVARDSTIDSDFYFAFCDASRWQVGETMPSLLLSISGQWFEKAGVEVVLKMLKESFAVADRRAPPYGLIDLAPSEDCFAGMAYVSTWMQRLPLHRWVEQGNWVYAASRKGDRARGIYWGNYFGPKILTRLGGRENFIRRYREQTKSADQAPNAHIWEFTNGVFVSLCLNPMGCKPGVPLDYSAMFNLQWLQRELGAKGVLCGWDVDSAAGADSESSRETVHVPIGQTQSNFVSQSFSNLNVAEMEWIRACLNEAGELAQKYFSMNKAGSLNPAALDRAFGCWLSQWQSRTGAEDPNTIINCIGLAFGQSLVDCLGMRWVVVTDSNGTDMGVCFGEPANRVLVFPTHAVAKRLETKETDFLQKLFEATRAQINGLNQIKK